MKIPVLNQPRFHVSRDFLCFFPLAPAVSDGSWTKVVRKHTEQSHADGINTNKGPYFSSIENIHVR